MTYIVLELFPEPFILTNMDGEIWKTDLETAKELALECQQGMVVPLDVDLIRNIELVYAYQKNIEETLNWYLK